MPNIIALYASVIVLFTLLYFLMSLIPFLFVKLNDPAVARLLRGLFRTCFVLIAGASVIAAVAFAVTGRPGFAVGMVLFALFAIAARRWFLQHMDAYWSASAAGDQMAIRRLRQLHCSGIGIALTQVVAVVGSIYVIA